MPRKKKCHDFCDTNEAKPDWCYTWNNYTEKDIEQLKLLKVMMHRCCKEVGEKGTKHLQGAILFKRGYRFSQLKKLFPKVRWDGTKTGDPENYCIKGEVVINIDERKQGERTDLRLIAERLKDGASIEEIAIEYPSQFIRYHKGIETLQRTLQKKTVEFEKIEVTVLIGSPGCGKTRKAYEMDKKLYNVPEPVNDKLWFDGYHGEETILLDDFYGWIKYHTLLQLLDGYPMSLPVKGGMVAKAWKKVIITSNKHPSDWYNREEWAALKRRITTIISINL